MEIPDELMPFIIMLCVATLIGLGVYIEYLRKKVKDEREKTLKLIEYQSDMVALNLAWVRELNIARIRYSKLYGIVSKEMRIADGDIKTHFTTTAAWIGSKGFKECLPHAPANQETIETALKENEGKIIEFFRSRL